MRRPSRRSLGENTRAVHLPPSPAVRQVPSGPPVWRTAAFGFAGSAEHAGLLNGDRPGYHHGRVANPTVDAFTSAVAALEGFQAPEPVECEAFASGMAAATAVLLAFGGAGAHVLAPADSPARARELLDGLFARFGVEASYVPMDDPDPVREAIRPDTGLVWAETLSGAGLAVADLPILAEIAHQSGALLAVDSTLTTPVVCRPLEHGADLVLHSATKYLGGHGDATGGVVAGPAEVMDAVRRVRVGTGAALAPDEAYLLRRGLETLPLRVRRQCDTANVFAAALARHPGVRSVDHPGLPGHPGHRTARALFDAGPEGTRFGAVVTITPYGGPEAGPALVDALRLVQASASVGGTRTCAAHLASTGGGADADPAAVRFSIGLEDADDLVRDVSEALDTVGRVLPGTPPAALVADPG